MRQTKGEPITINVYDLMDNTYLYPIGLGAYHSGVVAFGREYTFSDGGIFDTRIRDVEAPFRTSIDMGTFKGTYQEFQHIISSMRSEFASGTYNLYTKNCNCFSNALCQRLLNKEIPYWINRMARMGNTFGFNNDPNSKVDATAQITKQTTQQPATSNEGHKLSSTPQELPTDPEARRKMIAERYKSKQQK